MSENQDVGGSGLEERVRELFADGASDRVVSARRVIEGARRRRSRHRATAAGSSLAVLGVAAGAIALGGGHSGGGGSSSRAQEGVKPATSSTTSVAPKTCTAAVKGKVPATSTTTLDGLLFNTVSGMTLGIPWAIQIHVFPDKQSHVAWEDRLPVGSIPQAAKNAEHPGAMAQFRTPGVQGYTEFGMPTGSDENFFTIQQGEGIGTGTPAKPSETPGMSQKMYAGFKDYPAYVTSGWMAPDVDHMCAQYADHAEFVPVYQIQGGQFYVFGYSGTDRPQKVLGYNAAGKVVGSATATKGGPYFLVGLGADRQN